MQRKSRLAAFILLLSLFVPAWSGSLLLAQTSPTPQQLDQLLAPIALYPDSLLAQITTASTNPQEILDVSNWLLRNPGLQGSALTDAAEKQGFDAAFIALVNFPDVLNAMAEHVDDYSAIGQAFSADQGAVTASIQRLRAQAYAAGNLQTNQQQRVEVQQTAAAQPIYVIQPANPQVVYVPVYNPTVVYVRPPTNVVVVSYGPPIPLGVLFMSTRPWGWMGWGWNWSSHRCYYNHSVWVGWGNPYRPPNPWYRPRPIPYNGRPGYGGNWHYHPPNYRPPTPIRPPVNRPPWGPDNRPGNGYRPPTNRPRPPVQQPSPPQPGTRPTPPSTRPVQPNPRPQPPSTRPAQPNPKPQQPRPQQPGTRPAQPNPKPQQPRPQQPGTRPAQPLPAGPPPQPKL